MLLLLLLIISIRSIRISFLSGVLRFVSFSHLSSFAPRDGGQSRAFFLLVAVLSLNAASSSVNILGVAPRMRTSTALSVSSHRTRFGRSRRAGRARGGGGERD